ncbi:MAG TPA: SxtJ family membrane protein [Dinghuibacter sp.]|jgi:hypothetical protein|uniref:SxtJ family membrane protein n=1 Tax=Dinghuibacter sp. TaxID=2024697 RepID=UPI002BAC0BCD|nr:SxtJ family membrane protein [Dinghuibacter sp.]HTJ14917.1 SxtJ family membrane protein [Dinghuibacter sp.]
MKNNSKETVLVITVGFVAISLLTHKNAYAYIALAVGLAGALSKRISEWIDYGWTKLSHALGFVSNSVLLTIVYLTILTPVALIRKKKFRFDKSKTSNLENRDHLFTKEDFERTF